MHDRKAERLYEGFMGKPVHFAELLDVPDTFIEIGKVEQVFYTTREGKRVVRYVHAFDSRPRLLVADGGSEQESAALMIGSFRFSPRGFLG